VRASLLVAGAVALAVAAGSAWFLWKSPTSAPAARPSASRPSGSPVRADGAPAVAAPASASSQATPFVAPPGGAVVAFVEKGTREPLPGVAIEFRREPIGPGAPTHRATTDATGRVALDGLAVGRWRERPIDDYWLVDPLRDFVDVLPKPDPSPTTLALERGAVVTGSVVDRRGNAVAGATIALDSERELADWDDPSFSDSFESLVAETDGGGRYAIRAVPCGAPCRLRATHASFARSEIDGVEPRAGESFEAPPMVLGAGGSIRVAATSDGRAAEGAAVRVQAMLEPGDARVWWNERGEPDAATGADGVATLARLAPGVYAVGVLADGRRPFVRTGIVVEEDRATDVPATLEPGAPLAGVVVDAAGSPIARAAVAASRRIGRATATTDERGRFALSGLAPGSTAIDVEAAGFVALKTEAAAGPDEARLVMRRESSVSGQVVDREGRPVTAFRIFARPSRDSRDAVRRLRGSAPARRIEVSDPEGRFRVGGLGEATYELQAIALASPGLGSGRSAQVVVGDGAAVDGIRIEVESTVTLRARVLDAATREPLAGAIVTCPAPEAPPGQAGSPAGGETGRAGEDGWIVTPIPSSASSLRFAAKDHSASVVEPVPAPGESGAVEVEVALGRGASIAGTVRDGQGVAVAGAVVELLDAELRTLTSAQGEYAIAGLEAGEHEIGWLRSMDDDGYVEKATVTLAANESARVDFGPGARPGSRVFGVVSEGGAPVPGLQVGLVSTAPSADGQPRLARTDDRGAFEFLSVGAGEWSIGPLGDGSSVETSFESDGASPVRVDFDLPASRLVVTVLEAATREPLAGVFVELRFGEDERVGKETRGDGRAEFPRLYPGSATARVRGDRPYLQRSSPYVPQERSVTIPESGTAVLEILLATGVALEGRVTGPDGGATKRPRVTLVAEDGREIESARGETSDGRYRIEGLEPGTYAAIVRGPGAATTVFGDVRVAAGEGGRASRRDFTLGRGGSVATRVVSETGAPIVGAGLTCVATLANGSEVDVSRGRSNEDGGGVEFRLAPGTYEIRVESWVGDDDAGELQVASAPVTIVDGESTSITLTARPERDE